MELLAGCRDKNSNKKKISNLHPILTVAALEVESLFLFCYLSLSLFDHLWIPFSKRNFYNLSEKQGKEGKDIPC